MTIRGERRIPMLKSIGVAVVVAAGATYFLRAVNGGYSVRAWLFWPIALLWLYGALLSASCLAIGARVLRWVGVERERTILFRATTSFAVGLAAFAFAIYVAGFLHLLKGPFGFALPLLYLAIGWRDLRDLGRETIEALRAPPARPISALARAVAIAAAIYGIYNITLVYLEDLTPDVIYFDAAWVHLVVPEDYARHGGFQPFLADYAKNLTELASLIWTWSWLLPVPNETFRWMLALHIEFFVFLWTLAGISAVVEELLEERVRGVWAAFFLFPAIFVATSNLSGGADHFVALFVPPSFLFALRVAREGKRADAVLFGLLAGAAIATKAQAGFFLFACALLIAIGLARQALARRRADGSWSLRPLLVAIGWMLVGFLVLAIPRFGKPWVYFHDPFYPFAPDLFAARPTVPKAAQLVEEVFKDAKYRWHGTPIENLKSAFWYSLTYPFKAPFASNKIPFLGSLFVLSVPLVLLVEKSRRRLLAGALVAYVTVFLWAYTFRTDRNLQIVMPLLAAVSAAILARACDLGWAARAGVFGLVALHAIYGGDAPFYDGGQRLTSAIKLLDAGVEGKRDDRFHYRAAYLAIRDALPKDALVLYHNDRMTLGIDRDVYSDIAASQGLIDYGPMGGPRALYDRYKELGITHILHEPAHRPAPTKQTDVVFTDFTTRYARSVLRAGGYELLAMPASPPPPDPEPYRVLALGLGGYADGVYRLEDLGVVEAMTHPRYPPPRERVTIADAAAKLASVETVLVGARGAPLSAELTAAIDGDFKLAKTYSRGFSIYIRK